MNKLTLNYQYDVSFFDPKLDRDNFGFLSVSAKTDRISVKGGFWVQWQDVKDFGEALRVFPIPEDQPVVAQWGFNMQEGDDLILRVEVASADKRGTVVVRFEIADHAEPQSRARGQFFTNYPEVEEFSAGIARLISREVEGAILHGL